jgi:hypothetical protein
MRSDGTKVSVTLNAAVANNWPTPTVADRKGASRGKNAQGSLPLAEAVRETAVSQEATGSGSAWPTPSASMFNDAEDPAAWLARAETLKAKHSNGNGAGMPLAVAAKLATSASLEAHHWSTPQAHDAKGSPGATARTRGGYQRSLPAEASPGQTAATGMLSAAWVEGLMGFPPGWTELPPEPRAKKARAKKTTVAPASCGPATCSSATTVGPQGEASPSALGSHPASLAPSETAARG